MSTNDTYDLAVVGGGINGCGIARDAVGRGLSVVLFEQGDLASATSSASTKLVHGGLRYLEHYKFRLVREALIEREVLLRAAPHFIWPLRFVLPHHKGLRPRWMIRLGLFLYDNLGGRKILPGTRSINLRRDPTGTALKAEFTRGFEYSDCWVEDARLVVLNARDAAERGASIRTRTRIVAARREGAFWHLTAEDVETGGRSEIKARALVNAAGPWVSRFLSGVVRANDPDKVRMVKGSHIVVPKLYDHDRCYIFQNADGRICFAIPYETDFTLIGTTDLDYQGDPGEVTIAPQEIAYLCEAVSSYFVKPISPGDVVWTYSGVRPLYDDGASKAQEATRDYVLRLEKPEGAAPLLNVFGGKITTFRKLAEAALEKLEPHLPMKSGPWTAESTLPGGDVAVERVEATIEQLGAEYPFLLSSEARRLFRYYGTRARRILGNALTAADLGRRFGADLTEREVKHLMNEEWARTADDVLWRRSKLGLRFSRDEAAALDRWMAAERGASALVGAAGAREKLS